MVKLLQKGETVTLKNLVTDLQDIVIVTKWQTLSETDIEINSSAFLLTAQNKVKHNDDFICHNHPMSNNQSVLLKNNAFKISLNRLDEQIDKINFILSINNAELKNQKFSLLKEISIDIFNFSTKQKIMSYTLTDTSIETEIILAMLYRYQSEWKFRAIGQGYAAGLNQLARKFGVTFNQPKQTIVPPIENHEIKQQQKPIKHKTSKNKKQVSNTKQDIHNTDMMTKRDHYTPIVRWFEYKNCHAVVNESATDTSGFFDEVAIMLGDNYALLKIVIDTIKRRQFKGYEKAYIDLTRHSEQQIEIIKTFCKSLYDYTFVARYFYDNKTKKVILNLQTATKIVNFFNGEWLEWYAMMKIAVLCHENNIKFSCIRNMKIYPSFENSYYEIDVFFLINDMPLFIECKSGEYRGFIDKYSKLRQKLFINKQSFLMLISGVQQEQINGLNAMFDITFINEAMLFNHVQNIINSKNS